MWARGTGSTIIRIRSEPRYRNATFLNPTASRRTASIVMTATVLASSGYAAGYDTPQTLLLGASGSGDRSSPLANPAAMVERDYFQVFLSSYQGPDDWRGGQYLGMVAPVHGYGFSDKTLSAGILGDWEGNNAGLNPKHDYRGLERTYQLGYAMRMPLGLPFSHQLAFGANGYWHQFGRDAEGPARNFGLDAGLHWNPVYSSRRGEFYLDAALFNLISPFGFDAVTGERLRALPLNLNISALWRTPMRDLDVHAGLLVEDVNEEPGFERGYRPGAGITWRPKRAWELEMGADPLGLPQVGGAYRLFGEGRLKILEFRSRLSYGRIQFGMAGSLFTRKDMRIVPAPRYRRLKIEPDDDYYITGYGEPQRLFAAGRYELAAHAFGRQVAKHPSHLHVDSLAFSLGECFKRLGEHSLARRIYEGNLRKYTDGNHTRMIADNMRELMRLDYIEGRYDSALARDSLFRVRFPGSPMAPTFGFFKAQILFTRGKYPDAVPLYSLVPNDHEYHRQARHNLAICRMKTGEIRMALDAFTEVMDAPARTPSEFDIRESATLKAGLILFQLKDPRAESLLVEIDAGSAYYDEALLARAWLALRRGDFVRTRTLAAAILESLPYSVTAREARFLKAYAAYRLERKQEALGLVDSLLADTGAWSHPPQEAEAIHQAAADSGVYDSLQEEFYALAMRSPGYERYLRCGPRKPLKEYRRRHLLAAAYRNKEGKTRRYADAREQVSVLAVKLREELRRK